MSRMFVLFVILFFFEKLHVMEELNKDAQEIDNFSPLLISEIKSGIIVLLMPQSVENIGEFIAALQAMSNFAATSHENYEFVTADYFSKKINAFLMHSLTSDTQFIEVAQKLQEKVKEPGIFLTFKIKDIVNRIKRIRRRDQETIRLSLQDGLNLNFRINDYGLMYYIHLSREPELALELLEKEAQVNADDLPRDFSVPRSTHEQHPACKKLFRLLIEKGLNANYDFLWYETRKPLLWYACNVFDDLNLIELLLQKGANPRLQYISKPEMYRDVMSTPWKDAEKIQRTHPEILALFQKYLNS